MKWLRALLVVLISLENILIPLSYTQAAEGDIPVIEINYQTEDNKTPEAREYVGQVNAAATNGKIYNFYTLSGVVKTVKALKKGGSDVEGEEAKGYYHTGDGAAGYLVIAYDVINGKSLAYRDWIAATTTNENGKFALPIEKTNSGVYIVVLKRDGEQFRFITSYDVSSAKTNRSNVYPENGLNIGVIELSEEIKDITDYEEDLPNSVKVLDEETYWSCGQPSRIIYKDEDYNSEVTVKIPLEDESFVGNRLNIQTIKDIIDGNATTDKMPPAQRTPYKDIKEGRTSITRGENYTGTMSTLNFFNGVVNRNQPTKNSTGLPLCSEFLKSKHLNTMDSNKNYYTYNGLSAMVLPYLGQRKTESLEIQDATLRSTIACRDTNGANKTYYDLLQDGYDGAVIQQFFQDEYFEEYYTSLKTQEKPANDSMENGEQDNISRKLPFPTKEEVIANGNDPYPAGDYPALVEYTTSKPKKNQVINLYGGDTLVEEPQGQVFNVPFLEPEEQGIFVYELGPFKELCAESEVRDGGNKLIKNEELKGALKEDNRVTEGYLLTTKQLDEYKNGGKAPGPSLTEVKYYKDALGDNVFLSFLTNLITVFQGWLAPNTKMDSACFNVVDEDNPNSYTVLQGEGAEAECETIQNKYGEMACAEVNNTDVNPPVIEYREYKNFEFGCVGKEEYPLKVTSEQIEDGNTQLKGRPATQGTLIRDSFSLGGDSESPLLIGKSTMELFEVTGAGGPVLHIKREIDSIATDTLDYLRFSATLPDGTENNTKPYNTTLVRLIDRDARPADEGYIYAGVGSGSGGIRPDALEDPLPCPISCGAIPSCPSYPDCHGSNEYWAFVGASYQCNYPIPGLTGAMAPLDSSSVCSNKSPKKSEYGYALDVVSSCGDRNIFAPAYGDLTEWKVVKVSNAPQSGGTPTPDASLQGHVDIEGISGGKTIKLRFYHLGSIYVSSGGTVQPGEAIGEYATWIIANGGDNSHVHMEMLIDGQAVPPEDNLQCGG